MGRFGKISDNPINWSFKVGRLFAIDIRIHILFIVCAVWLVSTQVRDGGPDGSFTRALIDGLGIECLLFLVVLMHEFGHCWGARRTGGTAEEILIWPLGGLASVSPPHTARAHMITTVAGPMVNVIFCTLSAIVLTVWVGTASVVPINPLSPFSPIDPLVYTTAAQQWLMIFFGINYVLLLFNLLPVFPFDGGRILQAWLWKRKGHRRSMEIATSTGMFGAVAIALFGLFTDQGFLLFGVAAFGYITCWQQRRMLRETAEFGAGEFGYDFSKGYGAFDTDETETEPSPGFFERRRLQKLARSAERVREERDAHARAVEDTLRKVSAEGVESLTPKERRILEEETQRQRTSDSDR